MTAVAAQPSRNRSFLCIAFAGVPAQPAPPGAAPHLESTRAPRSRPYPLFPAPCHARVAVCKGASWQYELTCQVRSEFVLFMTVGIFS